METEMDAKSQPVSVMVVLARYEGERFGEVNALAAEIQSGGLDGYESELADLTRWHADALAAQSAMADMIAAANAVCGNTPPAGQSGHVDFGDALTMLQKALARVEGR
jgi:hypothetical protein